MGTLHSNPRGVYTRSITMFNNSTNITHSISYPAYRGFTISASTMPELLKLADWFWCPVNAAGITSTIELNKAIESSLEDTYPIIELNKVG